MKRIQTHAQLQALANELGVRRDWHEPDEQDLTARVEGVSFDNAGFWPTEDVRPTFRDTILEHHVILTQDGKDVAAINLATLFAWATGYRD